MLIVESVGGQLVFQKIQKLVLAIQKLEITGYAKNAMKNLFDLEPNKSFKRTAPTGAASQCIAGCGSLRSVAAPAVRLTLRYKFQ